ncbi:MAG: D-glycero-beta-D-manno-heptose-7-phosphate kinase [candidate division Zixibacteria bacterium]|jgi:D-beta-D-heptose 7-phosphate kinase/D-beta-D-heptose 1-phosphate adenosyltransferase|nr:D-glycero-beta-D-manno-heptose-7-phosphate kinase [candidate division Zixibacteria bacterium]
MSLKQDRIEQLLGGIGRSRVLIIGDIMLDEYLLGVVERISPEAPVPVVEVTSNRTNLGGAANVAANIRALGDESVLIGTVGADEAADKLGALLEQRGISRANMVTDPDRPTTIKTRLIAHSQQVVRFDREKRSPLTEPVERRMMEQVRSLITTTSAVIISDYGKGVITPSLLKSVTDLCNERSVFIAVDPKETNFHNYRRVSLITPNHHEAGFAYGRKILNEADLYEVGNGLLKKLEAKSILITRGPQGMSLFSTDHEPTHIPTFARQVFDVTGAGDTVIATFVSAVCAGATLPEAAVFANVAAGWTVAEIGTATISLKQLRKELTGHLKDGKLEAPTADNELSGK